MKKYSQRADGRYYTKLNTGKYDENGKPIRISLYAKSSKELEALVREKKMEIEAGLFALDKGVTFGAYAEKWLEVYKASRSIKTREMYETILNNHTSCLKDKKLKAVARIDIQQQVNQSSDKPRTCQQLIVTLKQIFDAAIDDGIIVRNPVKNIEMPRRVPKERRALTAAEKKAIKEADFTPLERAFIMTVYGCGMRPAEMYALTWTDIDFKNAEININKSLTFAASKTPVVVHPKTNSGVRTIQAPTAVMEALKAYKATSNALIVFPDENGGYRTKSAYANIFTYALKKIQGERGPIHTAQSEITMYTFRHNYCTELYYSGISIKEAQRLMGHSSHEMIMRVYSHLDESRENTREKINKICL